jgi:hypothetical protein
MKSTYILVTQHSSGLSALADGVTESVSALGKNFLKNKVAHSIRKNEFLAPRCQQVSKSFKALTFSTTVSFS